MNCGTHVRMWGLVGAFVALLPCAGTAQTIGFTFSATPPATANIVAGQPFSSMERGLDWVPGAMNKRPMAQIGNVNVAAPNARQDVSITTWRDGTTTDPVLHLHFVVTDRTQRHLCPPDVLINSQPCNAMGPLGTGDQIIIQIDPTNARNPSIGTSERRFQIVINPANTPQFVARKVKPGMLDPFSSDIDWDTPGATGLSSAPTVTIGAMSSYDVNMTLTRADLDATLAGDFGIAIAIINDLGHDHPVDSGGAPCQPWATTGTCTSVKDEVTGSGFPSSMAIDDTVSDPVLGTGDWKHPSTWGIGYWTATTGTVTLSQTPDPYWSNSIHVGVCTSPTFDSIDSSDVGGSQQLSTSSHPLQNWYQYYPGNPCQMKVWVRIYSSNTTSTVQKRLLVIWARPSIGPPTIQNNQDWYVVGSGTGVTAVSNLVGVRAPYTDSYVLWADPPPIAFTDHPCLRVYVLPDNAATTAWINSHTTPNVTIAGTPVRGLSDSERNDLDALVQGVDQIAQMNFTALQSMACPSTSPCISTTSIFRPVTTVLASLLGRRGSTANASAGFSAALQPPPDNRPRPDRRPVMFPGPFFRVATRGIGMSSAPGKAHHVYLKDIGGVAWAIPISLLQAAKQLSFNVDVGNPAFLTPAIAGKKPIESPPRTIFLSTTIVSSEGRSIFRRKTPLPQIRIDLSPRPMKAGEATRTTVTVVSAR